MEDLLCLPHHPRIGLEEVQIQVAMGVPAGTLVGTLVIPRISYLISRSNPQRQGKPAKLKLRQSKLHLLGSNLASRHSRQYHYGLLLQSAWVLNSFVWQ